MVDLLGTELGTYKASKHQCGGRSQSQELVNNTVLVTRVEACLVSRHLWPGACERVSLPAVALGSNWKPGIHDTNLSGCFCRLFHSS